jgi:hypothetical protein
MQKKQRIFINDLFKNVADEIEATEFPVWYRFTNAGIRVCYVDNDVADPIIYSIDGDIKLGYLIFEATKFTIECNFIVCDEVSETVTKLKTWLDSINSAYTNADIDSKTIYIE